MSRAFVEWIKGARSGVLALAASAVAAPLIVLLCVFAASPGQFAPAPPPVIASAPVA